MCIVYMELDHVFKLNLKVLEFGGKQNQTKTLGFKIWKTKFKYDFIKTSQNNFKCQKWD
jgi:hypothetical protein